jgi:hypothetical protein
VDDELESRPAAEQVAPGTPELGRVPEHVEAMEGRDEGVFLAGFTGIVKASASPQHVSY